MTDKLPACIRESCIGVGASLYEAMKAIQSGACGIALVTDSTGALLGVMTDGDIRRAVLAGASLQDRLEAYVVRNCKFVSPQVRRSDVLDLMRAHHLNQIPIIDQAGHLVGLHLLREMLGAEPRPNWAVIMAGGRGERLRPLTDRVPKPMIKVAGRPILERIVLHLVGFGIRRIFISVNYLADLIESHFGDGTAYGCRIDYLREAQPLGTGGSLRLLPEKPQHPLLVLNGDLVTQFDVGGILACHGQGHYMATMGLHEYVHEIPFAVVDVDSGRLTRISEKPTVSFLANTGIYVLEPALLDRIPDGIPMGVPSLFEDCIKRGEPTGSFFIEDEWTDVGRHDQLQQARGEDHTI